MSTKSYLKKYETEDYQTYAKYSHHRKWFNKLWLSETLGYDCGPSGIFPDKSGWYIVRPIMNLSGMSVGAEKKYIEEKDITKVQPGYFWCEWFEGNQYSVTFERVKNKWLQTSCWKADRDIDELYKFKKWMRYDHKIFRLPKFFDGLSDLDVINVEFIDDRPIEVHLRRSPDPDCNEFIPIWEGEQYLVDKYEVMGYSYTESYDSADGFLKTPRLGFMIK